MKRNHHILVSLLLLASVPVFGQMSDSSIISYIAKELKAGKSKSQIGTELLAKGVSMSQMTRLLQSANEIGISDSEYDINNKQEKKKTKHKSRTVGVEYEDFDLTDTLSFAEDDADSLKKKDVMKIYGHDMFRNRKLSFEPNENAATPSGYIIGPGDELVINVWGVNEAEINAEVTSEGKIYISQIGPVQVSGLSIEQATGKIKSALSRKYAVGGANPASHISVTLANVRTIMVNVVGEVNVPGTYRLSSLTTVFNALYRAGGVTEKGSLRNVQVYRGGKLLGVSDIYGFLFDGTSTGNFSLSDGDLIKVPTYSSLVEVSGGVKRPMYYETAEGETVDKIIEYAGGYSSDAYHNVISIQRRDADNGKVYTVKETEYGTFALNDGDIVTVYTNNRKDVFENRVEVKGMVVRPGVYAIGGEIATVRQLVEHAGGLMDDAFLSRAQLIREKADRSLYINAIAIGDVVSGKASDIMLNKNDILIVSNINEIEVKGDVRVNGFVKNPGNYEYAEGMTVEDLILLAGGLESGASSARVDVSRRILDKASTEATDTLAQIFSFRISEGLVVDGDSAFTLKPFDIVSVRKSPTYVEQKRVRVSGEITFPGEYTLVSNNERLSDLFKRAGGATPNGFVKGAMLKRHFSEDERNVQRNMKKLLKQGGASTADSTKFEVLNANEMYSIGINLDKAIESPGSEFDVVLHDGDELIIPSVTNTVRVHGEVLYPNAVNYLKDENVRYYIKQSGGFSNNAKRGKVYVVNMNGKVSVGLGAKVNPGSEIIVPARSKETKMSTGEWLAIGSSAASIATVIATIANLIKK